MDAKKGSPLRVKGNCEEGDDGVLDSQPES